MNSEIHNTEKISIYIPTMDRPRFVIRALSYYATTGFKGRILIGDSSTGQNFDKVKNFKRSLDGKLNILHKFYPREDYSGSQIMHSLSQLLETDYACFSGDDDFLVPRTLGLCAEFLDDNAEFIGAHGLMINFELEDGNRYYGKLAETEYTRGLNAEHDLASDRFVAYMCYPISVQFDLMRKNTLIQMYSKADSTPTRYFGEEILPCALSVISGKIAEIDSLHTVFQVHDEHHFSWHSHNMYDLITDPAFSETIQVVKSSITNALMKEDGIEKKDAQEIVDRELWHHIYGMMMTHYNKRYRNNGKDDNKTDNKTKEKPILSQISALIHNIPGITRPVSVVGLLRFLYRKLKMLGTRKDEKEEDQPEQDAEIFTLEALLNPSSSHHADFMPIHNIITHEDKEII